MDPFGTPAIYYAKTPIYNTKLFMHDNMQIDANQSIEFEDEILEDSLSVPSSAVSVGGLSVDYFEPPEPLSVPAIIPPISANPIHKYNPSGMQNIGPIAQSDVLQPPKQKYADMIICLRNLYYTAQALLNHRTSQVEELIRKRSKYSFKYSVSSDQKYLFKMRKYTHRITSNKHAYMCQHQITIKIRNTLVLLGYKFDDLPNCS